MPLETLLCLGQKKVRYLKDMQILYEMDSKHQMTSEIASSLLEACKYGIILHLLKEVDFKKPCVLF